MPNQAIRNKVFRLDATRLSEDDSLVSVCIPYWFRNLLLDTTERYLWSRVWQNGDSTHNLTGQEIDKIERAIYRLTIECEPVNDCCEQIDDILTRLEELENMNINVNCGCGCGGCGGSQTVPPPTQPEDPTLPPSEEPTPPTDPESLAYRCNAAYYLTDFFGQQLVYENNRPEYSEWEQMIVAFFAPFGVAVVAIHELVYYAWSALAGLIWGVMGAAQITTALSTFRDSFACAVYTASNDDQARRQFNDVIDAAFSFSTVLRWVSKALTAIIPFEIAFQGFTVSLPPAYQNLQCCGGSGGSGGSAPVPPTNPEGYVWLPFAPGHFSFDSRSGDGSAIEQLGQGWLKAGFVGNYGASLWDVVTSSILNDSRLPAEGASVAALALYLVDMDYEPAGGSPLSIWEFATASGIDWFDGSTGPPEMPKSMLLYQPAHASAVAGILSSFDYDTGDAFSSVWSVSHQVGGGSARTMTSKCYLYWLIELQS